MIFPAMLPPETGPVLLAVTLISLISVMGAVILLGRGGVQKYLPVLVALAAGALLGDTFLHLLPHAVMDQGGFTSTITYGVLGGLIGFFFIEGLIHWHHHGEDVHHHEPGEVHSFGWMNLIGDGLHNFIDGMLIASAWMVGGPQAGIATTIAVALHEGPQEFGDFAVLLHAGFTVKKAVVLNLLTALSAVLGALVVLAVGDQGLADVMVPIAAGGFIYIACADLVPEIRKRAKGWALVPIFVALMLGLGLMVGVHAFAHDFEHGHGEHGAHGPREGILAPFQDPAGEAAGRMEWKLDPDAGRIEVWITTGGGDGEPFTLPVDATVTLTLHELDRSVALRVREPVENVDSDGYATVDEGRTHYFVLEAADGQGNEGELAWLRDETFTSRASATFVREGVLYTGGPFTLMPFDHDGGHGHSHSHGHSHK